METDLEFKIQPLPSNMDTLDQGLEFVSFRSLMIVFEQYVILEVLGSINDIRKYGIYTLKELVKSSDEEVQQLLNCSRWANHSELFETLEYYKQTNDQPIHKSEFTKGSLERIIALHADNESERSRLLKILQELYRFSETHGKQFGTSPF